MMKLFLWSLSCASLATVDASHWKMTGSDGRTIETNKNDFEMPQFVAMGDFAKDLNASGTVEIFKLQSGMVECDPDTWGNIGGKFLILSPGLFNPHKCLNNLFGPGSLFGKMQSRGAAGAIFYTSFVCHEYFAMRRYSFDYLDIGFPIVADGPHTGLRSAVSKAGPLNASVTLYVTQDVNPFITAGFDGAHLWVSYVVWFAFIALFLVGLHTLVKVLRTRKIGIAHMVVVMEMIVCLARMFQCGPFGALVYTTAVAYTFQVSWLLQNLPFALSNICTIFLTVQWLTLLSPRVVDTRITVVAYTIGGLFAFGVLIAEWYGHFLVLFTTGDSSVSNSTRVVAQNLNLACVSLFSASVLFVIGRFIYLKAQGSQKMPAAIRRVLKWVLLQLVSLILTIPLGPNRAASVTKARCSGYPFWAYYTLIAVLLNSASEIFAFRALASTSSSSSSSSSSS